MDKRIVELRRSIDADPSDHISIQMYESLMKRLGAYKFIMFTDELDIVGKYQCEISIKEVHPIQKEHAYVKTDYYKNWWLSEGKDHDFKSNKKTWSRTNNRNYTCVMLTKKEIEEKCEAYEVEGKKINGEGIYPIWPNVTSSGEIKFHYGTATYEQFVPFDREWEPFKKVIDGRTTGHIIEEVMRSYDGATRVEQDENGYFVAVPFSAFFGYAMNVDTLFNEIYSEGLDVSFITAREDPDMALIYFNTPPYGYNDFYRLNTVIRNHSANSAPGQRIYSEETGTPLEDDTEETTLEELSEESNV